MFNFRRTKGRFSAWPWKQAGYEQLMAHRVAPEAEADLDDIWCYIARSGSSLEIAGRFTGFLAGRSYLLANNPYIGRRRDDELRTGLRSFPVRETIILYRIEDEDVLILRSARQHGYQSSFGRKLTGMRGLWPQSVFQSGAAMERPQCMLRPSRSRRFVAHPRRRGRSITTTRTQHLQRS